MRAEFDGGNFLGRVMVQRQMMTRERLGIGMRRGVDARSCCAAFAWSLIATAPVTLLCLASAPALAVCGGDCNDDGSVTVNEVITGVNIALGNAPLSACLNADVGGDGAVTINDLVRAVANTLNGCPPPDTATPEPTSTMAPPTATPTVPTPTATGTPPEPPPIPTEANALLDWLRAGNYLGWPAESAPHPSAGPHFGTVRVFVNPLFFDSLDAGGPSHPAGAAAVKELYGAGSDVQGWSVMVKVQDDSADGAGWFWYERFGSSVFASSTGAAICTGCHSLGQDYFRSPFPLQ